MDTEINYPDEVKPNSHNAGKKFEELVAYYFFSLNWILTPCKTKKDQYEIGDFYEGIEAKEDTRILDTGNVSIEIAEKTKASNYKWIESGILKKDKCWLYVQGNENIIFVFAKKWLIKIYEGKYINKTWEPNETIRTFLMPIEEAKQIALLYWENTYNDSTADKMDKMHKEKSLQDM